MLSPIKVVAFNVSLFWALSNTHVFTNNRAFTIIGDTMLKKSLLLAIITFLLFAGNAYAAEEELVFFDLSIAGYSIGMTYDEATVVRPFHYVEDVPSPPAREPYYRATVEHIYVDDVEMTLFVDFINDKVQKVVGQFHPSALEDMIRRLQIALGSGENKSRVITKKNGSENKQVIYRWDFPTAKLLLVGLSSNSDFALVSLVSKREKNQGEQVKGEE